MESTNNNNNNNQLIFLSEFKELRNELSVVKKRIDQLEESHERQQEKINFLERENHVLKTQLNINDNKEGGSVLKRKRTDQDQEKETESKSASTSSDKKKPKTKNNDEEAVVLPQYDNGDSFDSLSDDLLHKIVEFEGKCYEKFGSINKRCRNIYDVEAYKLKKETCLYGYGTLDMMLQHYLQKRKEGSLAYHRIFVISEAVIIYNRLDAIDWIIQLGDIELVIELCCSAVEFGRINILSKVFCKCNLTMLDELLNCTNGLCYQAVSSNKLQTLKWLRKYGAKLDIETFTLARDEGYDQILQYLRSEGCPEPSEDRDESSVNSDDE